MMLIAVVEKNKFFFVSQCLVFLGDSEGSYFNEVVMPDTGEEIARPRKISIIRYG